MKTRLKMPMMIMWILIKMNSIILMTGWMTLGI